MKRIFDFLRLFIGCYILSILSFQSRSEETMFRTPVILIPGVGENQMTAYLINEFKNSTMLIWKDPQSVSDPTYLTFIMELIYNKISHTTHRKNPYVIEVPGWGDTLTMEYLGNKRDILRTPFGMLVNHLIKYPFYLRNITLRGAPYDFRKAPNELKIYYDKLKTLVEETYNNSDQTKVSIIGHGYGCLVAVYFLNLMSLEWKEEYLQSFISVSGPYGGSVDNLLSVTLGKLLNNNTKFRPSQYKAFFMSFPSSAMLLPNPKYFGTKSLIQTNEFNYNAYSYRHLFNTLGSETGYEMYNDVKNLIDPSETPTGVDLYCFHGAGMKTLESFYIQSFILEDPRLVMGPGDEHANALSLEVCKNWKNSKYYEIKGASHTNILTNLNFLTKLDDILTNRSK